MSQSLTILEEKVKAVIEAITLARTEKMQLAQENRILTDKVAALETEIKAIRSEADVPDADLDVDEILEDSPRVDAEASAEAFSGSLGEQRENRNVTDRLENMLKLLDDTDLD